MMTFVQCKKTNWYENYRENDKSPFGTYIIYNEADKLFNNNEVIYLKENIFDYLAENYVDIEENYANYICIKSSADKLHGIGLKDLLDFVYNGNDAFLALNYFSDELKEILEFETQNSDKTIFAPVNLKKLKGELYLENNDFDKQNFSYDRNLRKNFFESYNDEKTIVLGTQKILNVDEPVFIKIYHGKGAVYLHTQPIVFSNYNLLNNNYKYAENALSYLPNKKTLWDPQVMEGDFASNNSSESRESVFKFFLQNPSLKWSLYIFFFGLLLFMLFNARRKQRPIPIIPELKNSTVEFTHTIANLYLRENDHKGLVDKKIQYFLERVRRKYYINTNNLNDSFVKSLALKSGKSKTATNYLINTIISLNKKYECTQDELYRLNTLIDNFFKLNKNG